MLAEADAEDVAAAAGGDVAVVAGLAACQPLNPTMRKKTMLWSFGPWVNFAGLLGAVVVSVVGHRPHGRRFLGAWSELQRAPHSVVPTTVPSPFSPSPLP